MLLLAAAGAHARSTLNRTEDGIQANPAVEVAAADAAPATPAAAIESAAVTIPDAPLPQQTTATPSPTPQAGQQSQPDQQSQPGQSPQAGQQSQSDQPSQAGQEPQLTRQQQAERDIKAQEHQRILGVMPAFNTTNNQDAVPLSGMQKIKLSFRSAVDPWQFGITVIASAIGQAENSHPDWGQGWEAYGKRYGASYLDLFDGTIIGNGLLPALLRQDPRYFRMGEGTPLRPNSKKKRFFYALSTNVVCKGDNGKWQPNVSNVGGNLISGTISQYYYPRSERGVGLIFTNALVVTAEGGVGSELLEFWPDIHRKLFKNRKDSYTAAADAAQSKKQTPPAVPKQEETPAPVTPAPITPAPVTPAPVTPGPTQP